MARKLTYTYISGEIFRFVKHEVHKSRVASTGSQYGCRKNASHANIVRFLFLTPGNVGNMKTHFRGVQQSKSRQPTGEHSTGEDSTYPQPAPAQSVLSHRYSRDLKNEYVLHKSNRTLLTDDFAVKFNLNTLWRTNSKGKNSKVGFSKILSRTGDTVNLKSGQG